MELTEKQYKKYFNYKPFLSPTTLKFIAIICLTLAQVTMIAFLIIVIPPVEMIYELETTDDVLGILSSTFYAIQNKDTFLTIFKVGKLCAPLLLVGLFSDLTVKKKNIGKKLVLYGALSIVFYVGIIITRYALSDVLDDLIKETALPDAFDDLVLKTLEQALSDIFSVYLQINVFIDLFMATLFYLFVVYVPKSEFWKKRKKLFRSFSSLPVLFIIASLVLGALNKSGVIFLPIYVTALLTYKGVAAHILFAAIVLFNKYRKKLYERKNRELSYDDYEKTNRFIFMFSVFMAALVLLIAIVNYLLYKIGYELGITWILAMKFDNNIFYGFLAPVFLFYNYKTKFRFKYIKILYYLYYVFLGAVLAIGYIIVLYELLSVLNVCAIVIIKIQGATESLPPDSSDVATGAMNIMNAFNFNLKIFNYNDLIYLM